MFLILALLSQGIQRQLGLHCEFYPELHSATLSQNNSNENHNSNNKTENQILHSLNYLHFTFIESETHPQMDSL